MTNITNDTPSCRDIYSDYESPNIAAIGVSTDKTKSHTKFAAKYQLPFPLLCESNAEVATAYGCYGFKKFMAKEFMGIIRSIQERSTLMVGLKMFGAIVKPESHAAEILGQLPDILPEGRINNSDSKSAR
ncbi:MULTISPECIES: peroxiredoxin [unclassified Microcoleus]|uniref:peroxiredoxin n=1 Tax=unclassified Microcoleus TaxID=2642155 RepID=UPI0025F284CF|nr:MULTISPECIES: peroxiredoxin [unclassified Microcoleus]